MKVYALSGKIGVICRDEERKAAAEFFELFKTPWEFWEAGREYAVVLSSIDPNQVPVAKLIILCSAVQLRIDARHGFSLAAADSEFLIDQKGQWLPIYGGLARLQGPGIRILNGNAGSETVGLQHSESDTNIVRLGFGLFREAELLLGEGQPAKNAAIPTLDHHIQLLRDYILGAGIPLVEIPPQPAGHGLIACLTHDVDFVGIRHHVLDHTMWGFLHRALVGSVVDLVRGRTSIRRLFRNWIAVFELPLIYLGLVRDYWDEFRRYMEIEDGLTSTFFLIPFKNKAGERVPGKFASRRAARYDIGDVPRQIAGLVERGFEVGLHAIDAWNSVDAGCRELDRIAAFTGRRARGVRVHWLCFDGYSPATLQDAGFDYDSSRGYNEAVGYRNGTAQVFRPLGLGRLLELPLHIQDTAMFLTNRMDLTEVEAWDSCLAVLENAMRFGGVMTILWHMRSLGPERFWGEFYIRLLEELKIRRAWITSAGAVVDWFRERRTVAFEECTWDGRQLKLKLSADGESARPEMVVRVHQPGRPRTGDSKEQQSYEDHLWSGQPSFEFRLA